MSESQTDVDVRLAIAESHLRIAALEKSLELRFAADKTAADLARQTIDQRLHGLNEFRGAMSDQTNRMITRVEALGFLEAASKKTDADVEVIRERMEAQARPNYPLLIGALSTAGMALAGMWLIIGLKIDATITPNQMAVVALQEHEHQQDNILSIVQKEANDSMQADLISKSDRAQMNTRVSTIESTMSVGQADRRAHEEATKQKLVEIETQFCASDIVRNLMHASDMRIQSLLWAKVFSDSKMPTDNAYYPKVCNRSSPGNND